jgi:hypothetical protein
VPWYVRVGKALADVDTEAVVEFHYPKVIKSLPIRRPRGVWGGHMVPWGRGETKVRFVWKIC